MPNNKKTVNLFVNKLLLFLTAAVLITGCSSLKAKNPYEAASLEQVVSFKRERLPFPVNIRFTISQGAFGKSSHSEPGNEYSWDFDVPYGTPVVSLENGTVIEVWEPKGDGGCDPSFSKLAHNIKIEHKDGTVAQYVHVSSKVQAGDQVREGQEIAITAQNGWICNPQLHFGIYRSKNHLYDSPKRETIPVTFDGLPDFGRTKVGVTTSVPPDLQIAVVKEYPDTAKTVQVLIELAKQYDLTPYLFTRKIQIEKFAIPHDYPVLTLNTRHNDNPDVLLSTLLHEQLHRFVSGPNEGNTQAAIKELRSKFEKVPVGGSEGGFNEESTYLHLIVCWLELQADKKYLGNDRAYEIIGSMDHYAWIYKQIISQEQEVGKLILRHNLGFKPAVEVFATNFSRVTSDIVKYDEAFAKMEESFSRIPEKIKSKKWVKQKLKHMVDVDQYMRKYMDIPFQQNYSLEEKTEFQNVFPSRFSFVDSRNTSELKRLMKTYPWFTISSFGKQAEQQAWLLVQHADLDPEFQKQVLKTLKDLLSKHETDSSNFAYLSDRVDSSFSDLSKRKPQKYGTQGKCTGPGLWVPHEIEDPPNLDKRRKEIGLNSEEVYIKMFKDICH